MKFICLRENLKRALNITERFTGKNISLPILGNVLFETTSTVIKISSTNLEYAVELILPGEVIRSGKVSVPAKIINPLINSLSEEKLELEEKQKNLFIRSYEKEIKINGFSPEDFPLIPKIKKSTNLVLDGSGFRLGLERVLPAVSTSEFKPELGGVFFKITPQNLILAATDTFRLAEDNLEISNPDKYSGSFILPYRSSQELIRVLGEMETEVKITLEENQIEFKTPNLRIISRLIDGNFPEYSAIIPQNFETSIFIAKKEFSDTLRTSSIFASKFQEITLNMEDKNLELISLNQDVGECQAKIGAKSSGKGFKISFNFRYLLDGLNSLDEEEIFLGINSSDTPALLRNRSSGNFLYVLMPLRLT